MVLLVAVAGFKPTKEHLTPGLHYRECQIQCTRPEMMMYPRTATGYVQSRWGRKRPEMKANQQDHKPTLLPNGFHRDVCAFPTIC